MRTDLTLAEATARRQAAAEAYLATPTDETARFVRVTFAELAYALRFGGAS